MKNTLRRPKSPEAETIVPEINPTKEALIARFSDQFPKASHVNVINVYDNRWRVNVYEKDEGVFTTQRMVHSEFVIAG